MSDLYNLKKGQITVADASSTTASDAELDTLAGVTAGTATASKAVVLKADKWGYFSFDWAEVPSVSAV